MAYPPIDLGDYLPQKYPNVPSRFTLRPEAYRPRYWQDKALNYWENPQRVARYKQVIKAQPQGYKQPEWLDDKALDVIDRSYNELQKQNGNEMWWNWRPLAYDHPLSSELRQLQVPPLRTLQSMGEERFYVPPEKEELPNPDQGGMTDEDWNKLPRWQRAMVWFLQSPIFSSAMGGIAGMAGGATLAGPWGALGGGLLGAGGGYYAYKNPESDLASVLMYLDYPREWMEQILGTGAQVYYSATEPEKYGELPAWDELMGWMQSAWQAGHIYTQGMGGGFTVPGLGEDANEYLKIAQESFMGAYPFGLPQNLDVLNSLVEADIELDPFLDWIGKTIPGMETWYTPPGLEKQAAAGEVWLAGSPEPIPAPAIAAAMFDIRERIDKGEQPEAVVQEYMQKYGLSGDVKEIVSGFVIDPLDWAPFITNKGAAGVLRAAGKYDAATAFATTHGITEGLQKYGVIKRATTPITELSEANAVTRWLTGVTKEGDVKILAPATEQGGLFRYLLSMKPQSRATEVVNTSAANLALVLSRLDDPTPDQLVALIKGLAETPEAVAKELSMRSINAPDGAAIPMFLKDFVEVADEHLLKYKATEINRRLLNNLAEVTGKTPAEVLQQVANATDAEILLRQFVDDARAKGGDAGDAIVKAYEDSKQALSQVPVEEQLTGAKLQEMVKIFVEDQLPHDIDTFRAQLYTAAMDRAANWAADWFGVKPDPTWVQASQMVKSAQSLLLLGLNPVYFVNNALNNLVTSSATGVFGMRSAKQIDEIWARAGIEPPRLRAGVGPVALGDELTHTGIRQAAQAKGRIADATRFINERTGKLQVFSNLSMKAEQFASAQAYTSGFLQFMSRHWRQGTGFSRMPAPLERALSNIDPSLPNLVYGAIKGGLNQAEIESALWGGLTRRTVDAVLPELAEQLKARGVDISEADIAEMLSHSGVKKALDDALADAKTDQDVRDAFNKVNEMVQDRLDEMVANDLERTAATVAGQVATEGFPAVLELWDQRVVDFTERWFENFAEWEKAFADTANMDYNSKNLVMRKVAAEQKRKWDRYYVNERTKYKAMVDGLGMADEQARKILDVVDQAQQNMNEFYTLRSQRNAEFFTKKFDSTQERQLAWDTLQTELMEAYNDMTSKEVYLQGEMDAELIKYMTEKYGGEAGQAAAQWREGVNAIRENMIQEMRAMREALRTMPVDQRRTEWTRFLHGRDGYMTQISDLFTANIEGAHELYNRLRGRGGEAPATGAPEPPPGGPPPEGGPPPGEAPGTGEGIPLMVTMGMREAMRKLGYSEDEIRSYNPQEMWDIINNETLAEPSAPEAPTPPEPGTPGPVQDLSPVGQKVTVNYRGETYEGTIVDNVKIMSDGVPYARVAREGGSSNGVWVPLEAVEGLGQRIKEQIDIPEVLSPTQQQQFADNALLASEHGIPLVDEEGQRISGAEIHLMNAIKKYSNKDLSEYQRVKDVPTRIVREALEERARVKAEQDALWGMEALEEALGPADTFVEEPEVHPINKAIIENRLDDLPEDVRADVEQAYAELAAAVDIAEQGYRIAHEADGIGGSREWTGVKSTYPEWWSELKNPYYKDADGVKYTGKNAVSKILEDLAAGTVNPKNKKGDNYVLVERTIGQVFDYLDNKRAYMLAIGEVPDIGRQYRNTLVIQRNIKSLAVWNNLEHLNRYFNEINDYIAEVADIPYEMIELEMETMLDTQDMILARMEELERIPPEELTQLGRDINRLASAEISANEATHLAHDFQWNNEVPVSELFKMKADQKALEYDRVVRAGLMRREIKNKILRHFLEGQENVLKGTWDAKDQADMVMKLMDARAHVWAKDTGRQAWEWYDHTIADVTKRSIDVTNDPYVLEHHTNNRTTQGYRDFVEGNALQDDNGELIPLFHGTTHDFRRFDPTLAHIESHYGAAIYLSDSIDDVNVNYAGFGPDLRMRVGSMADDIGQAIWDDPGAWVSEIAEYLEIPEDTVWEAIDLSDDPMGALFPNESGGSFTYDVDEVQKLAEKLARERLAGRSEGLVMPVYARMENPARLDDVRPSYVEIGDLLLEDYDYVADMLQDNPEGWLDYIREYYGEADDWRPDRDTLDRLMESDRYDIADQISMEAIENSKYNEFVTALEDALKESDLGYPVTEAKNWIDANMWDGVYIAEGAYLKDIMAALRQWLSENAVMVDTGTNLEWGVGEIAQAFLRNLGYDGIVMDAHNSFTGMDIPPGTLHYILWEPGKVKSVFNMGDFDITNPDLFYQRSWVPQPNLDVTGSGVSVQWNDVRSATAALVGEELIPLYESEGGAFIISQDPMGGYVLDSVFTGQHRFDTLHEANRVAWEQAFTKAREGGGLLYQEMDPAADWYYSPLRQVVIDKMPNRQPPDQLLAMIQKGGVKGDELVWTGFEEWLNLRALIAEAIDNGDLVIEERRPTITEWTSYDEVTDGEVVHVDDTVYYEIKNSDGSDVTIFEDLVTEPSHGLMGKDFRFDNAADEYYTSALVFDSREKAEQFLNNYRAVSKAEVMSFLDDNNVKITETLRGEPDTGRLKELKDRQRWLGPLIREARAEITKHLTDILIDNQHPDYLDMNGEAYIVWDAYELGTEINRWIYDGDEFPFTGNVYEDLRVSLGPERFDRYIEWLDEHANNIVEMDAVAAGAQGTLPARFANNTLTPGQVSNRNYRELLIQLDPTTPAAQQILHKTQDDPVKRFTQSLHLNEWMPSEFTDLADAKSQAYDPAIFADWVLEQIRKKSWDRAERTVNQGRMIWDRFEYDPAATNVYTQGHWQEPNVLVHTRMADYIDTDGKKVLFLDEIQSDWHQQGRERGYADPITWDIQDAERIAARWKDELQLAWEAKRIHSEALADLRTARETMIRLEGMESNYTAKYTLEIPQRYGNYPRVFNTYDELIDWVRNTLAPTDATWAQYDAMMTAEYGSGWMREGTTLPGGAKYKYEVTPNRAILDAREQVALMQRIEARARGTKEIAYSDFLNFDPTFGLYDDFEPSRLPPAPFRNNKWGDLTMKRMLRYAAERGYDRLAWSSGRIQNERWNLANYYSKIEWRKIDFVPDQYDTQAGLSQELGWVELELFDSDGYHRGTQRVDVERLPEYVGQDITKRILDDPEYYGTLEGRDDLAVGSGGMEFFYDNYIPKFVRKYSKKYGSEPKPITILGTSGRAGEIGFFDVETPDGKTWRLRTNDGKKWTADEISYNRLEPPRPDERGIIWHDEQVENATNFYADTPDGVLIELGYDPSTVDRQTFLDRVDKWEVWGVDITDEMRKSVTKAQPLFMEKKGAVQFAADGRAMIYALQSPDISTVVHELGHVFRMDMRRTIDMVTDPVVKSRLLADWEIASEWAGAVLDDGEYLWSGEAANRYGVESEQYRAAVKAEEKFARGFEEYLMEGRAPNYDLVPAFEKFKEWLAHIYARLRGQLAGVTPEMKQVYDRLLSEYPEAADYQFTTEMGRAKVATGAAVYQPAPATNSYNFEKWFGDSKMVNRDGSPMKLYHGTSQDIAAFDSAKSRDFGIHLGTVDQAETIVGGMFKLRNVPQWVKGGNVIEVFVRIENPLRTNDYEWWGKGLRNLIAREGDAYMERAITPHLDYDGNLREAEVVATNIVHHPEMSTLGASGWLQGERRNEVLAIFERAGTSDTQLRLQPESYQQFRDWLIQEQMRNKRVANEKIIEHLERMGYDGIVYQNEAEGVGLKDSYIAFRPEQVKSVRNQGDWGTDDPRLMFQQEIPIEYEDGYATNLLYQDDMPEPTSPLGEVESNTPGAPIAQMEEEGYRNHIRPILNGLEGLMTGPDAQVPDSIARAPNNLDPATMNQLKTYMGQVYGELADTKLAGVRWAENRRDAALLNYSRRYGFDNVLTAIFPYQFWYTRSALQWALRFIDKPGWLSNYARIRNFQRKTMETPGFPQRLRNKSKIPIPFLPEWASGGMYIDPFRHLFPFEQFARPYEQRVQDQNMITKRTISDLQQQAENEEITQQAALQAIQSQSGPLWEKAWAAAELEIESQTSNPWDFINLIMSPSLPISYAYNWATGQKDEIGQLPATRLIQNVSGALGANQGRGWNIEGPLRRALDMPEQSKYHDYHVDRELANLTAEGALTPEQATLAMTERQGDAFLMAEQRVAQTQQIKYVGASLGADIFPEGEQDMRALKLEYDRAWEATNQGDEGALERFWDKYPEYESRRLLFKEGEDRLRQFLISSIWDAYYNEELPALTKREITEQLGDVFTQAFVNKETRSYDSIDTPTLTQWARTFNGVVPSTAPETPEAQIQLSSPEAAAMYQEFVDEKYAKFGDISQVLSVFYEAPEEMQDQIKQLLPQIDDYYEWRNEQFAKNPDLIPLAISDTSKVADAPPEVQTLYYQFQYQRQEMFPGIFELQDEYFKLGDDRKAKAKFREEHPELPQYWEWRREFMRQYPNMIPYLMSEESLAEAVLGDEQYSSGGGGGSSSSKKKKDKEDEPTEINISALPKVLKDRLLDYYIYGTPLGTNTRRKLREYWESQGSPGEKLNDFIRGPLRQELYAPSGAPDWTADDIDINQLDPIVVKRLNAYYHIDEPLSNGVIKALKKFWREQGKPGDTFDYFLDDLLASLF